MKMIFSILRPLGCCLIALSFCQLIPVRAEGVKVSKEETVTKFEIASWILNRGEGREAMVEDLLKTHQLEGMTELALHDLIGFPSRIIDGHELYNLQGVRDSCCVGPVKTKCLDLAMSKGKVEQVSISLRELGAPTLPEGAPIPDAN